MINLKLGLMSRRFYKLRTYLTIGEIASLLNLSASQIRFYEKKGLLTPHLIDENGYRLYSYKEIETLEIISAFRKLNLSINEIKEILNQNSSYNFISILENVEQQVNKEIMDLKNTLTSIKKFKKSYADFSNSLEKITYYPKRTLYVIDNDISINKGEKELYEFVKKHELLYYDSNYQFITIFGNSGVVSCLYDHINNSKISHFPTYELKEGFYFSSNMDISNYDELDKVKELGIRRCEALGHELLGEGILVEDFTTFLFSRTKIHLTFQISVNPSNSSYF